MNFLLRKKLELEDFFRFAPFSQLATARVIRIADQVTWQQSPNSRFNSISRLIRAARVCPSGSFRQLLEEIIERKLSAIKPDQVRWDVVASDSKKTTIEKGIILKSPGVNGEKGVLLISFENQWIRMFRHCDLEKLSAHFDLVLAPSWSPPHDLALYLANKMWPTNLYSLVSNLDDMDIFKRIYPRTIAIPLLASNWVNPAIFQVETKVPKLYDIVVLANFAKYKRHFSIFRLIRNMKRKPKVLLLGVPIQGRTRETIMKEARLYGVENHVTILERLPDGEMIKAIQSARVGMIASMNEGSCVAVVEMMFLNIPVALFANAIIGSRCFVCEKTGVLLNSHDAEGLEKFIASSETFSPREVMEARQVSCHGSTQVLNQTLRQAAIENGKLWTRDIVAHHWRPNPMYLTKTDEVEFEPLYRDFENQYGVALKCPIA